MDSIAKTLRQMADPKTAAFTAKTIPNIDPKSILGIKTPQLRALAKQWDAAAPLELSVKVVPPSSAFFYV